MNDQNNVTINNDDNDDFDYDMYTPPKYADFEQDCEDCECEEEYVHVSMLEDDDMDGIFNKAITDLFGVCT